MGRYLDLVAQVGGAIEHQAADRSGEEASDLSQEVTLATAPQEPREVVTVMYQKIFYDWAIADGTYTPEELRRAPKVVKPGPELWYRMCWPGGTPQPITDRMSQNVWGR
jgi:hypothetical protein